jgi:ribulose-phosphate 3-epimerase
MLRPRIAASILTADLAHLADQVKLVEERADLIHVDVMDAHFVPVLTVGPVVVGSLRRVTGLPLHCHLQVDRPEALLDDLAAAGADIVSGHVEAVGRPDELVDAALARGLRPGLAVSPETAVEEVFPYLDRLDRVVVLSVHPGWAGQPFMEQALPKIESVRREIDRRGLATEVEVDGGIDERTGGRCVEAGATVLAAASAIFGAPDPGEAAGRLAGVAERATVPR